MEKASKGVILVAGATLLSVAYWTRGKRNRKQKEEGSDLAKARLPNLLLGERKAKLPKVVCSEWLVNEEWLPNVSYVFKRSIVIRESSLEKLLVVTDFDATLTSGSSIQCHDLVGFSKLMSQGFRDDFAPLLDWQTNVAVDGVEWWDKAHSLMVKHGQPPRHLIPRLVRESAMTFRDGALELLQTLAALEVPVLIVSAGISDIIEEVLRQHGALTENITVCSNRLNYAADSAPQSLSPDPPITSFTKSTAFRASASFFKQHAQRTSLIVLGDSCTDIDAAAEIPYEHTISVGFLNDKPIEKAAKYAQTFDALVLGSEGSISAVTGLVQDIAAGHCKVGAALGAGSATK